MSEGIDFRMLESLWNDGVPTAPTVSLMKLGTLRHIVAEMMTRVPDYRETHLQDLVREIVESDLSDDVTVEIHIDLEERE